MIQTHTISGLTFLSVEVPMDAISFRIQGRNIYCDHHGHAHSLITLMQLPAIQEYRIIADSLDSEGFVKVFYPKCYCYTCTHITSIGKYFTYAIGLSDFDDDISEDCATEQAAWQSAATHITGGKRWVLVEIVNE